MRTFSDKNLDDYEAEVERVKNVFLTILRDMKKGLDNGAQPGDTATSTMIQAWIDGIHIH